MAEAVPGRRLCRRWPRHRAQALQELRAASGASAKAGAGAAVARARAGVKEGTGSLSAHGLIAHAVALRASHEGLALSSVRGESREGFA